LGLTYRGISLINFLSAQIVRSILTSKTNLPYPSLISKRVILATVSAKVSLIVNYKLYFSLISKFKISDEQATSAYELIKPFLFVEHSGNRGSHTHKAVFLANLDDPEFWDKISQNVPTDDQESVASYASFASFASFTEEKEEQQKPLTTSSAFNRLVVSILISSGPSFLKLKPLSF